MLEVGGEAMAHRAGHAWGTILFQRKQVGSAAPVLYSPSPPSPPVPRVQAFCSFPSTPADGYASPSPAGRAMDTALAAGSSPIMAGVLLWPASGLFATSGFLSLTTASMNGARRGARRGARPAGKTCCTGSAFALCSDRMWLCDASQNARNAEARHRYIRCDPGSVKRARSPISTQPRYPPNDFVANALVELSHSPRRASDPVIVRRWPCHPRRRAEQATLHVVGRCECELAWPMCRLASCGWTDA